MAPTVEGQVEVNGLLMGPETDYPLAEFNPYGRTVRADQAGERAWNHGGWSGAEWAEQVVVSLRVHTIGATTAEWAARHDALRAAFAPVGALADNVELRYMRGGVERLMFGRPRMVEPEVAPGAMRTLDRLAFVALDPLTYSGVEHSIGPIALPSFVGGLAIPTLVPFTVESVRVGGTVEVTNAGTAETGFVMRIDGPVTEPRVALQRPDGLIQTLSWPLDLAAGEFLLVDTAAKTALLNGLPQANQSPGFVEWPQLPAGMSVLRFDAADRTHTGTLTVTYRDAWY